MKRMCAFLAGVPIAGLLASCAGTTSDATNRTWAPRRIAETESSR